MGVIELIFSGTIVIFQKLIYFFALYTFEEIAPACPVFPTFSELSMQQGLRQDSEAATINELTDQSKRISC